MKIYIETGEWAIRWLGSTEALIIMEDTITAGEAVCQAGLPDEEIGILSLDGARILRSHILQDGDTVKVYPCIIGG